MQEIIRSAFKTSAENMLRLSQSESVIHSLEKAANEISESYEKGGSVFVCGNGGSAADAQHFVAELVSKLDRDRSPIRAFALTVDTSILTAIGNDYGYEFAFSRQVDGLMRTNDILISITTSGRSKNIIKAMEVARKKGIKNILLSGRTGADALSLADISILAPGETTASIQEAHLAIYHTLCFLIEKALVKKGLIFYK